MECFVDELPKDCIECPFCQDIKVNAGMDRLLFCKANKGKSIKNIEKSFDKCIVKNEFQSLADYTKQVRKEVCEKIKKQIFNHFNVKNMEEYENLSLIDSLFTADVVIEMLDTILKEYNNKGNKE